MRYQTYKTILKEYSDFSHQQLFDKDNLDAINYLSKRGLKKDVIHEFKLGYIPRKNNFYEELLKKYSNE